MNEAPVLSLRARGLLGLFAELGRVVAASEAVELVREGRDAVRAAYRELEEAGLIKVVRFQSSSGRWATEYRLTRPWKTDAGFSGDLSEEQLVATSSNLVAVLPNGSTSTSSGSPNCPNENEEYIEMAWPGFDDEPSKGSDGESGAVGKLPADKKQLRQQKYTRTKIEAVPEHMRRHERPETEWTTADLVSEFYDLTRNAAPGAPGQVHGRNLTTWINQRVGEGTPRIAVLKAIRMFFNDPRLVRDPGIGQPMWRRFLAFYPTVHGAVVKTDDGDYSDASFLGHQEKMMKMLEG